jgi:hypothetical protein
MRMYVRLRWIVFVVLAPFVVLGLLVLIVKAYGLVRYDPAYFTDAYLEQYGTLGDTVRTMERALQTRDQATLSELQGLRWPGELETASSMIFAKLWERTDRYTTYLFFDVETYERHLYHFEQVKGRWVVSPSDLYYTMQSGQWKRVFWPLAVIWWLLGGVAIGLVWILRTSERARAWLYGEE